MERQVYRAADIASVTSEHDSVYVRENFGLSPLKIKVIPNFIDIDIFLPSTDFSSKNWGRLLFVGRISHQKNLFNLVWYLSDY